MMESILHGLDPHQLRQRSAPRRALDARVVLETPLGPLEGWCLNTSEGGLRVLVVDDEHTSLDAACAGELVAVCVEGEAARLGRIVWRELREGGAVLGIAFDGSAPAIDARPA